VEAHGPQLMVQVYVDEEQMRAYIFQYYRDSQAMLTHWELSDPYIRDVSQYITVKRLDLYGQPNEAVLAGVRTFSASGVRLTVTPHFAGFARFPAGEGESLPQSVGAGE
jgi:hypothetical protein